MSIELLSASWQFTHSSLILLMAAALLLIGCARSTPGASANTQLTVQTVIVGDPSSEPAAALPALPRFQPVSRLRTDDDNPKNDDVCRFTADVLAGEPAADGLVDIPPSHPDIFYFGRVDCAAPEGPTFAYPAVSIRAVFTGTALDIRLQDAATKTGPEHSAYFDVIIDDEPPVKLRVVPETSVYPVARNLKEGTHTVEIIKRNESGYRSIGNYGKASFLGFRIDAGAQMLPCPARPFRIEFIGDSITCGYGNEVSVYDPTTFPHTTLHSNAAAAWSALTARALGADYMAVAYSGKGVVRNNAGDPSAPMPEVYERILPDDNASAAFDVRAFVPDLLVLNLGTNDYSEGLTPEDFPALRRRFVAGYLSFLHHLRGLYPETPFVLTIGPMMSDYYPQGLNAWTAIQSDMVEIRDRRHADGDSAVHLLVFDPQSPPYGEDWHPAAHTHHEMAEKLLRFIQNNHLLP